MTTNTNEYWPFAVSDEDRRWPEMLEKIAFLDELHSAGFKAFRSGVNDYGAESETRGGIIIERGRKLWELRLSKEDDRRFSAFVSKFPSAGKALASWLKGASEHGIYSDIKGDLVVPPGCSTSYTLSKKADDAEVISSKP
jgi:hypothetical protein